MEDLYTEVEVQYKYDYGIDNHLETTGKLKINSDYFNNVYGVTMNYGDFLNYDLLWNDFIAGRNWGKTKDGRLVLTDAGALNKSIMESPSKYLTRDWEEIKRLRREKVTPELSVSEKLEDVIAPELST